MNRLLLFIFICFSTCLISQDLYPNLTEKIKGTNDSIIQVKIEKIYLNELSKNPKNSLLLKLWKFTIYDSLGYSDLEDSLCFELLPKADKINHPKAARIYSYAGNKQYEENEYEKGISLLHRGLEISRKYKDQKSVSVFLKEIGVAYRKLNDLKNAEKYLRDALSVAIKIKDELQIANVYLALGNALREKKDMKNAMKCFEKSLAIALKLNNSRLIAGNYNNIGLIEDSKKDYNGALKHFMKALEMNKYTGNKLWESFNYLNIGNTYDNMKQYKMAIKYYTLSNNIKIELGDSLSLLSGYLNIGSSSSRDLDFKTAYEFLNKYVKLKDTLNIKEQSNLLNSLEAKYESDKKQSEIEHLKMSSELQNVKNESLKMQSQKNRNISILSILAAISLLIGVGFLLKSNKKRKQINKLLNQKNSEIEEANHSIQEALSELSIKNKEVIDSINYATYIQQAALPNISQLSTDFLHFELFFSPKDIVSGDFYFSYQLYKKSIFGVADCTGHGVPGAMVSLIGMNSLDKVVREEKHSLSSSMVDSLNNHVKESLNRGGESTNDGMDISFCYLNHEDNVLHFTGANHTALILRKSNELSFKNEDDRISIRLQNDNFTLIQLAGVRRPIGKSISEEPFYEVNMKMIKNDRIILFSDGFADQTGGEHDKKLKKGALLSMLLESSDLPIKEQLAVMKNQFDKWKGDHEQVDDVCLLIVEILS